MCVTLSCEQFNGSKEKKNCIHRLGTEEATNCHQEHVEEAGKERNSHAKVEVTVNDDGFL